jgi:copper chaperone CopZ
VIVTETNIQTAEFGIEGMTCNSCAEHVKFEVNKLAGVINASASYESKNAIVQFDNSKTTVSEIEKTINGTGYKVISSPSAEK